MLLTFKTSIRGRNNLNIKPFIFPWTIKYRTTALISFKNIAHIYYMFSDILFLFQGQIRTESYSNVGPARKSTFTKGISAGMRSSSVEIKNCSNVPYALTKQLRRGHWRVISCLNTENIVYPWLIHKLFDYLWSWTGTLYIF